MRTGKEPAQPAAKSPSAIRAAPVTIVFKIPHRSASQPAGSESRMGPT